MFRYLIFAIGILAALPLVVVLLLLLNTPITRVGAFYLFGYALLVAGMLTVPWWHRRSFALVLLGGTLILALIALRILFPPSESKLVLPTLPQQAGPRWLNRLLDEQDVVLLGTRIAGVLGILNSPREQESLFPVFAKTYEEMRSQRVTPLSPFPMTYLNQQHRNAFDVVIGEPATNTPPTSAILFLHGFGGNFTVQCWLMAKAGERIGAMTVCPSTGFRGDWWSPEGAAIVQESLTYLEQRGVERIYLAGLSSLHPKSPKSWESYVNYRFNCDTLGSFRAFSDANYLMAASVQANWRSAFKTFSRD